MDIVLLGTGNAATVLSKTLRTAGHRIVQVYGRTQKATESLANDLGTSFVTEAEAINQKAELYLIAVSDQAVEEVANFLSLRDKTVVHTAASVSLDVLKGKAKHYGVFYPLQSMRKELQQLPDVSVLVDASDEETLQVLKDLAATITENVFVADDTVRLKMHLAAVVVNNFTNHLFTLVDEYCRNEDLDFALLLPLIKETVFRLDETTPSKAQTGPALRNDSTTISKHLQLLEKAPALKKFYALFTQSIQHRQ